MSPRIVLAAGALAASVVAAGHALAEPPAATEQGPVTTDQVRVTSVIDGDTLRVSSTSGRPMGRVRLLGINAPEISHGHGEAQYYGATATGALRSFAPVGTTVVLRGDPTQADRDVYGRLLRYVETNEVDIGEQLLTRGAARVYDSHPAVRRAHRYLEVSKEAHQHKRGLWERC